MRGIGRWFVIIPILLILGLVFWRTFYFRPQDIPVPPYVSLHGIVTSPGETFGDQVPEPTVTPVPSGLTLDRLFSAVHATPSGVAQGRIRTLIATGDVIPARSVNAGEVRRRDFLWPWRNIAGLTSGADVTLINLETPLFSPCQTTDSGMHFCGDAANVAGLVYGGVDVANLANNHAGNYGAEGIRATTQLLSKSGIAVSGLGEPYVRDVRGMKFAFIGFDDVGSAPPIAKADTAEIAREVRAAKDSGAQVIVVSFHWGVEYTDRPTDRQKTFGHAAIDAGATLVIGNHPHWVQGAELYKGHLIVYAHGNTIFDQMWSEPTRYGVIGTYTFVDDRLADAQFFPLYIRDYGQPVLLTGSGAQSVLNAMRSVSFTTD